MKTGVIIKDRLATAAMMLLAALLAALMAGAGAALACGGNPGPCGCSFECQCAACDCGGHDGCNEDGCECNYMGLSHSELLEELLDWLSSLAPNGNEANHILQEQHHWELVVPDLNWDDIVEVLFDVFESGTDTGEHEKSMAVGGYTVVVTHGNDPDTGYYRIGDGWVVAPG